MGKKSSRNNIPGISKSHFSFREGGKGPKIRSASMTVEAAIALPFFLILMIALLYFIPVMQLQIKVQLIIEEFSEKTAVYAYAEENEQTGGSLVAGENIRTIFEENYPLTVYGSISGKLSDEIESSGVSGTWNTSESKIDFDASEVDVVVSYQQKIRGMPDAVGKISVLQRSRRRLYTGRSLLDDSGTEEDGEIYVYVTSNRTVYHTDLSCPYLSPTVIYLSMEEIAASRNKSGSIYYPCERCHPSESDAGGYITSYGDRYHNSLSCPSLSRNIQKVPFSSVGDLPLCSKCSGQVE